MTDPTDRSAQLEGILLRMARHRDAQGKKLRTQAAQIERLQAAIRGSIGVDALDLDNLYRDGILLPGDLGEDA